MKIFKNIISFYGLKYSSGVCSEAFDSHYREQCGEAYFQRRYYFDQRYRQCRMFWYDNCRGTSRNVFPDLDTCQSYCEDATQSPTRGKKNIRIYIPYHQLSL